MKVRNLVPAMILFAAPCAGASEISLEISAPAAPEKKAAMFPYGPDYSEAVAPDAKKDGAAIGAALGSAAGVDVQRRGAPGAQGDISIRGSSFQQNLVLIDGMRMNDPQTAHHNLDLPLTAYDIEKMDVLRGPYSSVYGPDAFAGAVNIITRKPDRDRVSARLALAEFSTWSALVSCDRKWEKLGQTASLSKSASGGFRPGTDYVTENMFSKSSLALPGGELNLSLGYLDKDFGASQFYSAATKEEREHTRTRFAGLSAGFGAGGSLTLEPKLYFRRHDDKFSYLYNSVHYANTHITDAAGGELRIKRELGGLGVVSAGGEYSEEKINSSNIGGHEAVSRAVFAQYAVSPAPGVALDASLREDSHSSWGWQASPGLRLGYTLSPEAKLWAMAGRSFRAPSFTELYYKDPGNIGNAGLKPEKSESYETGLDWRLSKTLGVRAAVYRRYESNLIDWTKQTPAAPWAANNIGKVRVWGFEEAMESGIGALCASLKYSYIYKQNPSASYISKYALRYARHKADLGLKYAMPRAGILELNVSAVRRVNEKGYVLADTEFSKKYGAMEMAAGVTNILNTRYEEIPGAAAPGRWFNISLGYSFI
ncbi:MAG: TonB-dependent receptor [Elusimicrobia bacterium]|nr:TonB-dependent receptor [Elusimicrobiota bacterium]